MNLHPGLSGTYATQKSVILPQSKSRAGLGLEAMKSKALRGMSGPMNTNHAHIQQQNGGCLTHIKSEEAGRLHNAGLNECESNGIKLGELQGPCLQAPGMLDSSCQHSSHNTTCQKSVLANTQLGSQDATCGICRTAPIPRLHSETHGLYTCPAPPYLQPQAQQTTLEGTKGGPRALVAGRHTQHGSHAGHCSPSQRLPITLNKVSQSKLDHV